jgi:uncharacterized protein with NAD-binding domain and iron-sulfur cluster
MAGNDNKPTRVAIVGGGCASVSTAFELTRPEHNGKYEVTIYQQGFRLGGKGASGRGRGSRIEEHGLHIWMGFYENAFRLVRECYRELDRDPDSRFADWDDVFYPDRLTGVKDDHADGTSSSWLTYFPPGAGSPGDPDERPQAFTMDQYFIRALQLIEALLLSARRDEIINAQDEPVNNQTINVAILERISRIVRLGQLGTITVAVEAVHLARFIFESPTLVPLHSLTQLIDMLSSFVNSQLHALIGSDTELKRIFEIVDLTLTCIRGSLKSGLVSHPNGFDPISDLDWRDWLRKHGASDLAVNSSFLASLYNIGFAYEDGDMSKPSAGAGEALRCAVRAFLTYRGSFFWKMQTGMGDAIFSPFYEVLSRRGVRFEYFHRLKNMGLSKHRAGEVPHIEELEFDVQAKLRNKGEYQPLIDVDGTPCWPVEPLWDQLKNGARLKKAKVDFESFWDDTSVGNRSLKVGKDFDAVVLAVGLGEVPYVASELLERFPHWQLMTKKVKTVATKALQIWTSESISELGWRDASVNLTGIPGAFETWADMSHLIKDEQFEEEPKSLAYFCSSLHTPSKLPSRDDTAYRDKYMKQVTEEAELYLNESVKHIWPSAINEHGFRWDLLIDPDGASGGTASEQLATQFISANVNPTDRYVLFTPNSSQYRISPLDTDVSNMTIAGDWTDNGLNVGCVEAAVMSGRLAAHAISTEPALEDITGYDHP